MKKSTFTKLILPLLMWTTIGLSGVSAQTEKVDESYRVVLKLNDDTFMALKNTGFVKAEVPKSQRNKIVAVKVIKQEAFIDEPLEVEAEKSVSRGVLTIKITDAALEQIEFRPLLIKVTEHKFSKVLLDYQSARMKRSKSNQNAQTETQTETKARFDEKNRFFVRRDEGHGIVAATLDASVLRVKTIYGGYEVPWTEIAAVHFDETQNVSLVLRNGDKMSGKLNQQKIKLRTNWGDHEIEASKLYSFTRNREQKFLSTNSIDGVKFRLYDFSGDSRSVGY